MLEHLEEWEAQALREQQAQIARECRILADMQEERIAQYRRGKRAGSLSYTCSSCQSQHALPVEACVKDDSSSSETLCVGRDICQGSAIPLSSFVSDRCRPLHLRKRAL